MHLTHSNFTEEFLKLENGFKICLFKDVNHKTNTPAHFHVIIPLNTERNLIVCIITSQIEKLSQYYGLDSECIDSMIHIDYRIHTFLNRPSIVECNCSVSSTTVFLFSSK